MRESPEEGGFVASRHRIECVNKRDRYNFHEMIQKGNVGGRNADGTRWQMTQERAIQGVESGQWSFYVERPAGDRVDVIVAMSSTGHKYLKTTADGDQPNDLLSLPECP